MAQGSLVVVCDLGQNLVSVRLYGGAGGPLVGHISGPIIVGLPWWGMHTYSMVSFGFMWYGMV